MAGRDQDRAVQGNRRPGASKPESQFEVLEPSLPREPAGPVKDRGPEELGLVAVGKPKTASPESVSPLHDTETEPGVVDPVSERPSHQIRPRRESPPHRLPRSRRHPHVRVEDQDRIDPAGQRLDPPTHGVPPSRGIGPQDRRPSTSRDLRGAVLAPVVHDDDRVVRIAERAQGGEECWQGRRLVPGGNHDTDLHSIAFSRKKRSQDVRSRTTG